FFFQMCENVHSRRVEVAEPWSVRPMLAVYEILGGREKFLVDRLHALRGQRAGVLDLAVGVAMQHATWSKTLAEIRIFRIVRVLRLLFGVEVIEVAEELVEAVRRRQVLIPVTQMVLAELAGGIAIGFQNIGNARVERPKAELGAWQAHLSQAGADRRLPGDEGGAARRAALLAIPVGEDRTLLADAIDIGRLVAHDTQVVGDEVRPAAVVTHDKEDIRPAARWCRGLLRLRTLLSLYRLTLCTCCERRCRGEGSAAKENVAAVDIGVLGFFVTHFGPPKWWGGPASPGRRPAEQYGAR